MHCRLAIAGLLFCSVISTAQDSLQVVSRIHLPEALQSQFGWGDLRVGCAEDGSTLLLLVPPSEKAAHEIVALTPSATVSASIDVEKVEGLERAEIEDFAPGPNGDIYVMVRGVASERFKRDLNGQIRWAERRTDKTLWLVRFNAAGHFIGKAAMQADIGLLRVAVFPSGSVLALGYLPARNLAPFAGIFSQDGALVTPVKLPSTVLYLEPDKSGAVTLPVPMLARNGTVYVVMTGEKPTVATVNADGTVVSTVALRIPTTYRLGEPRIIGERIVAEIAPPKFENSDHFIELDVNSGEVLFLHSVPQHSWKLVCQTESSSIIALHGASGSVDVLATSAKENVVHHRLPR